MRRFALLVVGLLSVCGVCGKSPAVRVDLPCAVESGYYLVWVDTPAGPRRFLFDTGFSRSAISESLRGALRAEAQTSISATDFQGHTTRLEQVRIDSLALGSLVFRQRPVILLPDSSFVVRCFGVEGVVGSDLLQGLSVRISKTDSMIRLRSDIRAFNLPDKIRTAPMRLGRNRCPYVLASLGGERSKAWVWALFDMGSPTWFTCALEWDMTRFAANVMRTEGFPASMGLSERVEQEELVRGRIPAFTLAGVTIADVPFQSRPQSTHIIGNAILDQGDVLLDYRRKRFYFLPRPNASMQAEQPKIKNIYPTRRNGHLIVAHIWDEALSEVIAPGDRIVRLDAVAVDSVDLCRLLRGQTEGQTKTVDIERRDGSRVTIPIKEL